MLYATGMTAADMHKAQIGIASVWWEGNPCNMHLLDLAAHVKVGVTEAGLQGMRFNTIGVSDAISMGTEGEKISKSLDLVEFARWNAAGYLTSRKFRQVCPTR